MASSSASKQTSQRKRLFAGIDIGGTKLHAIVAEGEGKIVGRARKKTKAKLGFEAVMARVVECLNEACEEAKVPLAEIATVGVGAPSPVRDDGVIVNAPNMGWENAPLTASLAKLLGKPVAAENDCNVGTLGEYLFGAGVGAGSLVGFFMGTGLGGGVVMNGEVVRGKTRLAAELGHMIVAVNGRTCGCGHKGCLEAYASKSGMGSFFKRALGEGKRKSMITDEEDVELGNVRSRILAKAYQAGDAVAREALEEAAFYLGVGVANVITLLGPDRVVLGGGVMEALGKELLPKVRESAAALVFPAAAFASTEIVLSALGDDVVALGAMAYARSLNSAP